MTRIYRLTTRKRIENWLMRLFLKAGGKPNTTYLLTVKGRKTGQPRSVPVTRVEDDGQRCW